ncbi:MAG: ABC transporter permease [Gemmatimonadales bacterium]
MRRAPVFVAVATLSLAIGIGLSTATFAVVDSMLYPKIPIADIDRLFRANLRLGDQKHPPSTLEQVRALEGIPAVERVTAVTGSFDRVRVSVDGVDSYASLARTTPDFFATVGVAPAIGRLPSDEEIRTKSAVVLSASAWKRIFPGRASLDGATISTDDRTYAVVGVMPRGLEAVLYGEVWLPAASLVDLQDARGAVIIAKLRKGVDSLAVRPQLAVVAAGLTAAYVRPGAPAYEFRLHGMRPKPPNLRDNEFALLLLGIAVGVLAIACTNVSALALARGLTRRRDYALRVALGASRLAIGGEVLAEVLALGAAGALVGLMIAVALIGTLTHIVPEDLTMRGFNVPELNARVFAFTTLTLIAGIVIAGGVPAWRASRSNPSDPLKDNAGTTTGRSRTEFKVLVMGELAIAMALLMLATLTTLSTRKLVNYDFGFDARRMLAVSISMPGGHDSLPDAAKESIIQSSLRRASEMPGVAAVSTRGWGPLDGGQLMADVGRETELSNVRGGYFEAGPNFFSTLGVTMVSGRDFAPGDQERGAVVLSRSTAKLLFPHGDAIGRTVKLGGERSSRPWLQVIGIAPDIKLGVTPNPETTDTAVYAATPHRRLNYTDLVIRPVFGHPALNVALARAMRDGLPPHAFVQVDRLVRDYESEIRFKQFYDRVFSFLGVASLVLGAAGLFSVMSYTVGQRLREFAVRQALGASPRDVLRLVMRGAFELALGGTAFGALLSFWASAGVSTVLVGVKNTDPVSLVIAEITLLSVTMIASLVPAYRAMKADPVEVLRAT